jgi:cytochrome c oxidase subunit 2
VNGLQSAANPTGAHAAITYNLFGIFLGVTAFFFLLVLAFLGWAIWRRSRDADRERSLGVTVTVWAGAIVVGLLGLTLASYFADRGLAFAGAAQPPVRIKVTGQQWWWQVQYQSGLPSNDFATANEIHLPVGRRAHVELESDDVIHSLWIPNLAGKQDLIPGRTTDLDLLPTRVGHFRAQCAEFCGLQHAHMALDIIVETPEQFAAWLAKSRSPAPPPVTPDQQRGYAIVTGRQCSACHAITGTPAYGNVAPDLTRVAARATLAAAELPNKRDWLERWIADPQAIKPGNRMPKVPLTPSDRQAVVSYLETLQ